MTDLEIFCVGILLGMGISLALFATLNAVTESWKKDLKKKNTPHPPKSG